MEFECKYMKVGNRLLLAILCLRISHILYVHKFYFDRHKLSQLRDKSFRTKYHHVLSSPYFASFKNSTGPWTKTATSTITIFLFRVEEFLVWYFCNFWYCARKCYCMNKHLIMKASYNLYIRTFIWFNNSLNCKPNSKNACKMWTELTYKKNVIKIKLCALNCI